MIWQHKAACYLALEMYIGTKYLSLNLEEKIFILKMNFDLIVHFNPKRSKFV